MMCDTAGCTRLGLRERDPVIEGGKRITSPEKGESFPFIPSLPGEYRQVQCG